MKFAQPVAVILAMLLAVPIGLFPQRASASSPTKPKALPRSALLIDVNHATLDELKTLPGIEDANAAKIVKNRPYANKAQLSSKGVLSAATYKRIRDRIIAKQ